MIGIRIAVTPGFVYEKVHPTRQLVIIRHHDSAFSGRHLLALLERTGLQEFSLCGEDLSKYMLEDVRRMSQVVKEAGTEKQ